MQRNTGVLAFWAKKYGRQKELKSFHKIELDTFEEITRMKSWTLHEKQEILRLKIPVTSPFPTNVLGFFLFPAAVSMFFFTNNLSFLEGLKPHTHKNELKKGQNLFPLGGSKWGDPSRSIASWIFNSWLSFPTTKKATEFCAPSRLLLNTVTWFPL